MMERQDIRAEARLWEGLSEEERAILLASKLGGLEGADLDRVASALLAILLERGGLREMYAEAPSPARNELERLVSRLARIACEADDGALVHEAYAKELLLQALPLAGPLAAASSPTDWPELIERAHRHDVIAPVARQRAATAVAHALYRQAARELVPKSNSLLLARRPVSRGGWLPRSELAYLSVDRTSLSCALYLAGLQAGRHDHYGFDELLVGNSGRAKRVDEATVKFDPMLAGHAGKGFGTSGSPAPLQPAQGSELKARLFVALLSLAAQARAQDPADAEDCRIRAELSQLMSLLGYELGSNTSSTYYRRYRSRIVRYLLVDLPNRVAALQVSYPASDPLVVFERLLLRSVPLTRHGRPLDGECASLLQQALAVEGAQLEDAARQCPVAGFELEMSSELLQALGVAPPISAVEHVPRAVLGLRGPAFWLAWQVAFLRRWARPPRGGGGGKPLLRVLQEAGYLAKHDRGDRVRYKDALREWWNDVGKLVDISLLDEPGVRLYRAASRGWREVSTEVSRMLDDPRQRFSCDLLEELKVLFTVPRWRQQELAAVRKRARSVHGSGSRSR